MCCFACLLFSTGTASVASGETIESSKTDESVCSSTKLFEQYSSNGSLSLDDLDQLLKAVKNKCNILHWSKEEDSTHSSHENEHEHHEHESDKVYPPSPESSNGNGT